MGLFRRLVGYAYRLTHPTRYLLLLISLLQAASSQAATIYVHSAATATEDGSDWKNAFTDLQDGLAAAGPGDEIWVAAGVYVPGMTEGDTFKLISGVEIYGGFEGNPGTEGNFSVRDFESFVTVLSGDIEGNDLSDANSVVPDPTFIMGDNCDNVVSGDGIDRTAVLDGFTITAGQDGGGMINIGSSPTLSNLTFTGNSGGQGGGMANTNNSSPSLTDVVFSNNSSSGEGGGMYNNSSSPVLI